MTNDRSFIARRLRALAAGVAVAAAALLTAAPSASAGPMACNYDGATFNACVSYESYSPYTLSYYNFAAGFDHYMNPERARYILEPLPPCASNFQAHLWGEDGASDQYIRPLQMNPGYPALLSAGLTAHWHGDATSADQLDEDHGDDRDEVFARISYIDCYGGYKVEKDSGLILGHWEDYY